MKTIELSPCYHTSPFEQFKEENVKDLTHIKKDRISALYGLLKPDLTMLMYIAAQPANDNLVHIDQVMAQAATRMSLNSTRRGIRKLIHAGIIAKSMKRDHYFVDSRIMIV